MPSSEWERFMENYYGDPYMMWHDGIDEKSVTYLKGKERERAEDMLIESLREGNHYAAKGLRELRSEKAIPALEKHLFSGSGTLTVEISVALCMIKDTFDYVPHIIDIMKKHVFWTQRMYAARALRRFPTEEVVEALYQTIAKDSDYIVRNHASETILFLHGLEPAISQHKEIFGLMIVDYDKDDDASIQNAFSKYQKCADLLRALVDKEGELRTGSIIEDIWTWNYSDD
ncbi:MAG: HEAT repeat domain-containing protein [Candidatus Thorarchaeota archaeon]